jgi:GNAT superfamily N-acetyltransferase
MAGNALRDMFQAASNSAADTVSAPIDALAWALRRAGVPVGEAFGGSEWMRRKGLTAQPQNPLAALVGETAGLVSPLVAAARAPQIAVGLLKGADNLAQPRTLNPQAGVIDVEALQAAHPGVTFDLLQSGDGMPAELARIIVEKGQRGQGVGSEFMRDLSARADADNALLKLTASSDFGGSKSRLIDFYKRFGFVENKGRNRDFSVWGGMYRRPGAD